MQSYDDVRPGRGTKPMERAERGFDVATMVEASSQWQQIATLVKESPHKCVCAPGGRTGWRVISGGVLVLVRMRGAARSSVER
eukprot:364843-Chlamydomonas_euryale.AAC.14